MVIQMQPLEAEINLINQEFMLEWYTMKLHLSTQLTTPTARSIYMREVRVCCMCV